jgi:hypothetical protein
VLVAPNDIMDVDCEVDPLHPDMVSVTVLP